MIKEAGGPHDLGLALFKELKSLGYEGVELPIKIVIYYGIEKWKALLEESGLKVGTGETNISFVPCVCDSYVREHV